MVAHDVVFEVRRILHRDTHLAFLIHNVDLECGRETVPFDDFPVVGRIVAVVFFIAGTACVCGIAFHDGAVHFIDQVLDEFGFQVVGVAALAGTHLDGHAPFCRNAECFVDFDKPFGADVLGQINDRFLLFVLCVFHVVRELIVTGLTFVR